MTVMWVILTFFCMWVTFQLVTNIKVRQDVMLVTDILYRKHEMHQPVTVMLLTSLCW